MLRSICSSVLSLLTLLGSAQWNDSYSVASAEPIYAVEVHDGQVFGSANMDGFVRSTDNGLSWSPAGQSGFTTSFIGTRVSHIRSAGDDLLVVTFNPSYASSMVYRSSDGGITFVPDTAGLPKVAGNNECVNIDRIEHHDGLVVVDVANLGNWWKAPGASTWVQNQDAATLYAENFAFHAATAYTWAGYHLHSSTDMGATWTAAADAGVPAWFTESWLQADPVTGRLYVVGTSITTQEYRLLYSDNGGASWDSIPLAPIRGSNWLGTGQTITAIHAYDGRLSVALQNEAGTSAPNVWLTTDMATFQSDHAGLPIDAGQLQHGIGFARGGGRLFLALSSGGIWMKDAGTGFTDRSAPAALEVFPNPTDGSVLVRVAQGEGSLNVRDTHGALIATVRVTGELTPVQLPEAGAYIVEGEDRTGRRYAARVIHR
ncbi:MAG TPA: hypothetical protein PKE21_14990 [Flavobacteriales bacterium]|nr:hypothetical protein [Flavobacteriales bacterium]HMR28785.1 hypothetical protein [Flavobacteriales bacterium]